MLVVPPTADISIEMRYALLKSKLPPGVVEAVVSVLALAPMLRRAPSSVTALPATVIVPVFLIYIGKELSDGNALYVDVNKVSVAALAKSSQNMPQVVAAAVGVGVEVGIGVADEVGVAVDGVPEAPLPPPPPHAARVSSNEVNSRAGLKALCAMEIPNQ